MTRPLCLFLTLSSLFVEIVEAFQVILSYFRQERKIVFKRKKDFENNENAVWGFFFFVLLCAKMSNSISKI